MGCRVKAYGPRVINSWLAFTVARPLQLPPSARRAQIAKRQPTTVNPSPIAPSSCDAGMKRSPSQPTSNHLAPTRLNPRPISTRWKSLTPPGSDRTVRLVKSSPTAQIRATVSQAIEIAEFTLKVIRSTSVAYDTSYTTHIDP